MTPHLSLTLYALPNLKKKGIMNKMRTCIQAGLEYVWARIEEAFPNARQEITLGIIIFMHYSESSSVEHLTLKLIKRGTKVVGTMHVPGENGNPSDLWIERDEKWENVKAEERFVPRRQLTIRVDG